MGGKSLRLKENYKTAKCCNPGPEDRLKGYINYDNIVVAHRSSCPNLEKVEAGRLLDLEWNQITAEEPEKPGPDYASLDKTDFRILKHHREYGIDYSITVSSMLKLKRKTVFDRHGKLRGLGLLSRVEKLMIQYRKKIVKNKWIKHRNHTYYELTPKGELYLDFYLNSRK